MTHLPDLKSELGSRKAQFLNVLAKSLAIMGAVTAPYPGIGYTQDQGLGVYDAWKLSRTLDQVSDLFQSQQNGCRSTQEHQLSRSPVCDFRAVCRRLHENASGTILYRNSKGEVFSNEERKKAQVQLLECAISRRDRLTQKTSDGISKLVSRLSSQHRSLDQNLVQLNQKPRARSTQEIEKLIDQVKVRILEVLDKKKIPSNSQEIDNLKRRVLSVEFQYDPTVCKKSEAAYQGSKNTITVCEGARSFPEGTLFAIIAHELGHSIDPCSTLIQRSATREPGIVASRYPLNSTMRCLAGNDSAQAVYLSREVLEKQFADITRQLQSSHDSEYTQAGLAKARQDLSRGLKYVQLAGFCADPDRSPFGYHAGRAPGHTQMAEVAADWIAAEALASEMQALTPQRKYEMAFEAALTFRSGCIEAEGLSPNENAVATKLGCTIWGTLALPNLEDEHLSDEMRVDHIFLAHPDFQKALGCKAAYEKPHCE